MPIRVNGKDDQFLCPDLAIILTQVVPDELIMKLDVYLGQEPVDILANQLLTGVAQDLVNIAGHADNLAPPLEDVTRHVERCIDHEQVLVRGEFYLVVRPY